MPVPALSKVIYVDPAEILCKKLAVRDGLCVFDPRTTAIVLRTSLDSSWLRLYVLCAEEKQQGGLTACTIDDIALRSC